MYYSAHRLTNADLDFLLEAAAPGVRDRSRVRQRILEDQDYRRAFIGDDKTFQKVISDEDPFIRLSPTLYFEILLRKTRKELLVASHTIERSGLRKIAVFDTKEVADLLSREAVLVYLADMLSSFTKIESYTVTYRAKKGSWRRLRFSDLDIDSLITFCDTVDEDFRLGLFKRIGDICLFTLGLFPEFVRLAYRYPASGEIRPQVTGLARRSPEDYVEQGTRFYRLAAKHPAAKTAELSGVFWLLHGNFNSAKKPLNFIAEHYLNYRRHTLFGISPQ